MDDLFAILFLIAGVMIIVFGIKAFREKSDMSRRKKMMKFAGISFGVFIISFIVVGITADPIEKTEEVAAVNKEETEKDKVARELKEEQDKAAEEAKKIEDEAAKAKVDAEQKAKEEAEAKALGEAEAKNKEVILAELKLNGTGDSASKKFNLTDGFVIINSTHQGSSNFALELLDSNGNQIELVANTIGNYKGSQIYEISSGEYLYNVTADGSWTIEMSQFIPEKIITGSTSGKGDSVVFMNLESGARTFSMTHDGQSNFSVLVNDSALLANEIGSYSGSQVEKVEDSAVYYFNIVADGNWTLKVE